MSLATAKIDCTVSPLLSGAMEGCSIVRGPQLQRLCRQNCLLTYLLTLWSQSLCRPEQCNMLLSSYTLVFSKLSGVFPPELNGSGTVPRVPTDVL